MRCRLPVPAGKRRWLLIRRDPDEPTDLAYYLACGPERTPALDLVEVAHARWAIEEGFAQAKGEVGLDHYEVRTWQAWHRFITLALLAHAALVVLRAPQRPSWPPGRLTKRAVKKWACLHCVHRAHAHPAHGA